MKKINLGFLYILLPLFFFLYVKFSKETDIWFIFSHGRYILNNGFPHFEFLTIHENLHFVMQQWAWSFILYLLYHYLGSLGVIFLVGILNILIIFFTYKLCMKICNNSYFSYLITAIINLLIELNFVAPRPQMISLLLLLIVVYILELKNKSIFFIPLISLLLINFHASMWLMLFIICLPFLAEYLIKKDKYIFKLLIVMIISFLVGFINPYGIEAMTYVFSSYGIKLINQLIIEMQSFSLTGTNIVVYNSIQFLVLLLIAITAIITNIKKASIHSILLIIGLSIMAYLNLRNIALFLICAMPYASLIFKDRIMIDAEVKIKYFYIIFIALFLLFTYKTFNGDYKLRDTEMEPIVNFLNKKYDKNKIKLFCDFGTGPYLEYKGYRTYIDSRAEVFIKKFNHKKDIFNEYYKVLGGNINYDKFVDKYKFDILVVNEASNINNYLSSNSNFKAVYTKKDYIVYEKK